MPCSANSAFPCLRFLTGLFTYLAKREEGATHNGFVATHSARGQIPCALLVVLAATCLTSCGGGGSGGGSTENPTDPPSPPPPKPPGQLPTIDQPLLLDLEEVVPPGDVVAALGSVVRFALTLGPEHHPDGIEYTWYLDGKALAELRSRRARGTPPSSATSCGGSPRTAVSSSSSCGSAGGRWR